jgi:hypothetical protein
VDRVTDPMGDFSFKDGLTDRELLVRIATQLEDLTRRLDDSTRTFVTSTKDHEARIRVLEKFQWTILGASALISLLVALVFRVSRILF